MVSQEITNLRKEVESLKEELRKAKLELVRVLGRGY